MPPESTSGSKCRLTFFSSLFLIVGCVVGLIAGGAIATFVNYAPDKTLGGFFDWVVLDGEKARAFQVAVSLVLAVFGFSYALTLMGRSNARRWNETLKVEDGGNPAASLVWDETIKDGPSKDRLKQQFNDIRGRTVHHFRAFVDFSTWYYMAIGTFSLSALVAAVALFFLARDGWGPDNHNYELLAVFIVMSGAAAFYKSFVHVFRHVENIADNKQLYKNYVALENEVRSFAATLAVPAAGAAKSADDFIAYVDKKMSEFHNIAIGFDASKVPTYDGLFDALGKGKGASGQPVTERAAPPPSVNDGQAVRDKDKAGGGGNPRADSPARDGGKREGVGPEQNGRNENGPSAAAPAASVKTEAGA